ncbi:hypothetical protein E2562_037971 [Oryza meyeriana var. granulata]|uniref:peptidylprolyl isomerase n=1 Tax=Oryza meyeriana var. granulata TaxID=110450 RepID=A0A6G1CMU2_9ORYZ|nr:hypothetical protein E2562_037971 [Oryza meyeriana var. granulata]
MGNTMNGFLLALALLSLIINFREIAACIATERDALVAFNTSVKDPDGRLHSWHGDNCCSWSGVSCSKKTGHVIKLDLGEYSLNGQINPSLAGLTRLMYLNLSQSDFGGVPIPDFIGSFKMLSYLDLSHAGFGGTVPPQLGNLARLSYLDLSSSGSHVITVDNFQWVAKLNSLRSCHKHHENFDTVTYLFTLLGFAFGFCIVSTTFIFSAASRRTYFQFTDNADGRAATAAGSPAAEEPQCGVDNDPWNYLCMAALYALAVALPAEEKTKLSDEPPPIVCSLQINLMERVVEAAKPACVALSTSTFASSSSSSSATTPDPYLLAPPPSQSTMASPASSSCSAASPLLLPSARRPFPSSKAWPFRDGSAFRSRSSSSNKAPSPAVWRCCCCRCEAAGGASTPPQRGADDGGVLGPSTTRRSALGVSAVGLGLAAFDNALAAGLPPEEKPKLCDAGCEKELENVPMVTTESGLQYKDIKVGEGPSPPIGFQVAANYVAMVPNGQIFDSSLEKGQPYIFRVGSGQVIKGLDEGILSMKVGGLRRLYIPGPLAFPKGLTSAPGRARVPPSSPVVFDVNLLYIPGLDDE